MGGWLRLGGGNCTRSGVVSKLTGPAQVRYPPVFSAKWGLRQNWTLWYQDRLLRLSIVQKCPENDNSGNTPEHWVCPDLSWRLFKSLISSDTDNARKILLSCREMLLFKTSCQKTMLGFTLRSLENKFWTICPGFFVFLFRLRPAIENVLLWISCFSSEVKVSNEWCNELAMN